MTQDQLIKNLKQLKQIKPNQDWVAFNKTQILGQEEKTFENFFSVLWRKPAYATIATAMLLVVGIVGFLLVETTEKVVVYEPAELAEPKPEKEAIVALGYLQKEIDLVTEGIEKIGNIDDLEKLLVVNDTVMSITQAVEGVNVEIEKLEIIEENKENKILALRLSADKLVNTTHKMTATEVAQLIKDLETRTLTEAEQDDLEQAKIAYQNGVYNTALTYIIQISK